VPSSWLRLAVCICACDACSCACEACSCACDACNCACDACSHNCSVARSNNCTTTTVRLLSVTTLPQYSCAISWTASSLGYGPHRTGYDSRQGQETLPLLSTSRQAERTSQCAV
jgi:hypothetical protein